MEWKTFFHGVDDPDQRDGRELPDLPWSGKLFSTAWKTGRGRGSEVSGFSMAWKTFFHGVENRPGEGVGGFRIFHGVENFFPRRG